jgi:signal peptidase I
MLIAGDIGGTKTDLAIYSKESGPHALLAEVEAHSSDYPSLQAMVAEFLAHTKMSVDVASSDVAGPVIDGHVKATNLPWVMDDVCTRDETQRPGSNVPDSRRKARFWIGSLLGIAAVSFLLIHQLYQPVKIEGISMAPLLSDRELIAINRLVYHFEPIHRGDVVVFRYPLDSTQSFIKRIVGLPGEIVQIRQGLVYVNGNWLSEPYVQGECEDLSDFGPIQVPSRSYFVLGDCRSSSNDSREFGTVARRLIEGRAAFTYWPIDHVGLLSSIRSTKQSQMKHMAPIITHIPDF